MMKIRFLGALLAAGTLGCTWVALDPGAGGVAVRNAESVGACKRLGKTHTRTTDSVGFIPRRESAVEEELVRLARNEAVRMGGDVIAPLGPVADGEQDWAIYRCP